MSSMYPNRKHEPDAANKLRGAARLWFHPLISRANGGRMLEGREAGHFILRESSKEGSYALTVVLPGDAGLGHYLVMKVGAGCYFLQGSENTFLSLEELLAHYCEHDSVGMPCRLVVPGRHQPQGTASALLPSRPALPPRNSFRGASSPVHSSPAGYQQKTPQKFSSPLGIPNGSHTSGGGSSVSTSPHSFSSASNPSLCLPPFTSSLSSPGGTLEDNCDDTDEYADMSSPMLKALSLSSMASSSALASPTFHSPSSVDIVEDEEMYVEMQAGR